MTALVVCGALVVVALIISATVITLRVINSKGDAQLRREFMERALTEQAEKIVRDFPYRAKGILTPDETAAAARRRVY